MNLPGIQFHTGAYNELARFIDEVCIPCAHFGYCSILCHGSSYGGASEWREIKAQPVCIRQECKIDR